MKDLFSKQADLYAQYRPVYPKALFEFILERARDRGVALDCATGNGQVARTLSSFFQTVCAVDISENQLRHAVTAPNISYLVSRAERSPFKADTFDLITVAQAYHWLDSAEFCTEARRIAKPGALVAIWSYNLLSCEPSLQAIIRRWNYETLAPYWEAERQFLYSHYDTLAFKFERIQIPDFEIVVEWTRDKLIGYLKSWSALQKMVLQVGDGAFQQVLREIDTVWREKATRKFTFPVFLKLGRVKK